MIISTASVGSFSVTVLWLCGFLYDAIPRISTRPKLPSEITAVILELAARVQHAKDHKTKLLGLELEDRGDVREVVAKVYHRRNMAGTNSPASCAARVTWTSGHRMGRDRKAWFYRDFRAAHARSE